jgi:ABC-type lipoprotein release transport system permease subunit
MAAVLARFRAELRTQARNWVALALLVAVGAGLVIAAAAGARRTETAVPRSAAASNLSDVAVSQFGYSNLDFAQVKRLPGVEYAYRNDNFFFVGKTDRGRSLDVGKSGLIASADPAVGVSRDAPKILHGRRADPARIDEAVADEEAARLLGLRVGSRFTARFAAASQLQSFLADTGESGPFRMRGPRQTFKVVGISAVFSTATSNYSETQLTPAFYRALANRLARSPQFGVYLDRGQAGVPGFKAQIEPLARGRGAEFRTKDDYLSEVERAVHVQAAALWVLAGLAGIVAFLVLVQAFARQAFTQSVDYPVLRALGMTTRELAQVSLARAASIATVGAVLAVGVAIALSPLAPVGSLARKAEPDPGVSVDVLVIALGGAAALILLIAAAALPAWRAARTDSLAGARTADSANASPIGLRLARAGFPPTVVTGVRMALEPGTGRTAVPVRTTIAGAVVAVAAIAMALSFSASLGRLVDTPRLYGQNWDVQFGDGFSPDIAKEAYPALERDRFVEAYAGGTINEVSVDGTRVGVLALEQPKGSIGPSLIEGRPPAAADEVVLSPKTLGKIDADVGDIVPIAVGKRSVRARIVGKGVLSDIQGAHPLLGKGAMLTLDGYRRLVPGAPRNYFLVRFKPGADEQKALATLAEAQPLKGARPVDVANFNRIDGMPVLIGALLGLVAVATLVHALVTSIRRRRRDLAILKTLGFERAQISRVVVWQATTIVAVAMLAGLPVGIAAGRWGWTLFANALGVVPEAVVPVVPTLLVIPAALAVANIVAALPARVAARTRPALVLRAE